MKAKYLWVAILFLAGFIGSLYGEREKDLVTYKWLTGLPDDFDRSLRMFSGYFTVELKRFHYVFVTSQSNPLKDPLTLWLNGGPGCSSLLGMLYEHGPFVFEYNQTAQAEILKTNPFSWNKHSNVLYLETPVSVGYSASSNEKDYETNDELITEDHVAVLLEFFKNFPEYTNHDLYLAGEDYAGIYIPLLARRLLQYNKAPQPPINRINVKGIIIGNGVTYWPIDGPQLLPEFLAQRAIIDPDLHEAYNRKCQSTPPTPQCLEIVDQIKTLIKNLTLYNIYDKCNATTTFRQPKWAFPVDPGNECINVTAITTWFNDPAVKTGLNIEIDSPDWKICSSILNYTIDYKNGSLWAYPEILASGIKVLIYSGDVDAYVPVERTMKWIKKLREEQSYMPRSEWSAWFVEGKREDEKQLAGYCQSFDPGLEVCTVRGGGHSAPLSKPKEVQTLFNKFIGKADFFIQVTDL